MAYRILTEYNAPVHWDDYVSNRCLTRGRAKNGYKNGVSTGVFITTYPSDSNNVLIYRIDWNG